MKEFKVGDRVAILAEVIEIGENNDYPIIIKYDNSIIKDCITKDGRTETSDTQQNVRHLEDLQYMYGKEMYISSVDKDYSNTAYVIGKSNNGNYLAIAMKDVESFKKGKTVAIYQFKYAHLLTDNIPRNLIKERDKLLEKLTDIIIEIQQSKI